MSPLKDFPSDKSRSDLSTMSIQGCSPQLPGTLPCAGISANTRWYYPYLNTLFFQTTDHFSVIFWVRSRNLYLTWVRSRLHDLTRVRSSFWVRSDLLPRRSPISETSQPPPINFDHSFNQNSTLPLICTCYWLHSKKKNHVSKLVWYNCFDRWGSLSTSSCIFT